MSPVPKQLLNWLSYFRADARSAGGAQENRQMTERAGKQGRNARPRHRANPRRQRATGAAAGAPETKARRFPVAKLLLTGSKTSPAALTITLDELALFLEESLRLDAQAAAGEKRRLHFAAARRAGGRADARRGRQRGGRDPRHRDHADAGRAGVQRHRFGRLRHRLGREKVARPERLRALAGGLDAGVFRRREVRAGARLEFGERAGLRLRLGRAACEIRQAALRAPVRDRY